MRANCGDNNPNQHPDPMNLHHTGAYSVAPVDTNVQVDVNVPVVPTQNLLVKKH